VRKRDLVTGQRRMGPSGESETVSVLSPYGESETTAVFFLWIIIVSMYVCVSFFLVRVSCCVVFENTKNH